MVLSAKNTLMYYSKNAFIFYSGMFVLKFQSFVNTTFIFWLGNSIYSAIILFHIFYLISYVHSSMYPAAPVAYAY